MISAELRFEGFDARSWTNLVSLFLPGLPERLDRAPDATDAPFAEGEARPGGSLLVVVDDDDTILAASHSHRGRVRELAGTHVDRTALPTLALRAGARRVLVLREGVMEELAEQLGARFRTDDPYLAQVLEALRAARELETAGELTLWPNPIANVPIPAAATFERALDLVLPEGRAAVLALWDGPLWTAVVLRRRHAAIDLVAGPESLVRWSGPLGGDWRRDYRVILDAVARSVAPVHFGLFAEAPTVRSLLKAADAGTWAQAVAVRNVVISPMPRTVGAALGADAVRGIGRASARALGGLDLAGALLPLVREVRARVSHASTVSEVLGFDPLAVLGAILRRDETSETSDGS